MVGVNLPIRCFAHVTNLVAFELLKFVDQSLAGSAQPTQENNPEAAQSTISESKSDGNGSESGESQADHDETESDEEDALEESDEEEEDIYSAPKAKKTRKQASAPGPVQPESAKKKEVEVLTPMKKLRKHITLIRYSGHRRKLFLQLVKKANKRKMRDWELQQPENRNGEVDLIPERTPVLDVCTRWNSTHDMLELATKSKSVYNKLAKDKDASQYRISKDEWTAMEKLVALLRPFKSVSTKQGGSNYVSLGSTISSYQFLLSVLAKGEQQKAVPDAAIVAAREKLTTYYDSMAIVGNIAAVLDPRYNLAFIRKHWKDEWVEDLLGQLRDAFNHYKKLFSNDGAEKDSMRPQKRAKRDDDHYGSVDAWEAESEVQTGAADDEIERYTRLAKEPGQTNPLEWWKVHVSSYPILSRMARDYLATPSTSVPCERLFSSSGDMVTSQRAQLSPHNIRKAMCLKHWLRERHQILVGMDELLEAAEDKGVEGGQVGH